MDDRKKLVYLICAARPNFMKVAPLYHELQKQSWCEPQIVHTGQHYDANMSDSFFKDLELPSPHFNLEVGSGSHAEQVAGVMIEFEKLCLEKRPDLVVVVGDVNSTIACTIAAKKLHIPVAHLEAGLRSGDHTMPEEINRIVTDVLCDYLWTPSRDGDENLLKAGISKDKITLVGNIMMDSFEMLREKIEKAEKTRELNLSKGEFGLVTMHRPSNVDDHGKLQNIVGLLTEISKSLKLVFPVHPRTKKQLEATGLLEIFQKNPQIILLEPLNYIGFMSLLKDAVLVITDSGGIQEESTYLGIPCLTLRENTERPVTITEGTNILVREDNLLSEVKNCLQARSITQNTVPRRPELWDGKTAGRVCEVIKNAIV